LDQQYAHPITPATQARGLSHRSRDPDQAPAPATRGRQLPQEPHQALPAPEKSGERISVGGPVGHPVWSTPAPPPTVESAATACCRSPAHEEVIMNRIRRIRRIPHSLAGLPRWVGALLASAGAAPAVLATFPPRPPG